MKGIILAGGSGTRLYPLSKVINKHLLPLYDKPVIYYPLSTLMLAGIREICIITTPESIDGYRELFGDGSSFGLSLSYRVQEKPRGIAEAFIIGEDFINNDKVALILGDNIFHGNLRISEVVSNFETGATIFGYPVSDPKRFGVVSFDDEGNVLDIIEKPKVPPSNYAVTGLYLYDENVCEYSRKLSPSGRGELEITDLNKIYLEKGNLQVVLWSRGIAWLDVGRAHSLFEASVFVSSVERRQRYKIACPEEIAVRMGFITNRKMKDLCRTYPDGEYKDYIIMILEEI